MSSREIDILPFKVCKWFVALGISIHLSLKQYLDTCHKQIAKHKGHE